MRSKLVFAFVVLGLLVTSCQSLPVRQPTNASFAQATDDELKIMRSPASGPHLDSSNYYYDPTDTSCDGYPRLKVETAAGTCLGLVLPKERAIDPVAKRAFSMPRTLAQIPGTQDYLVTDMGSWHPGRGALFLLSRGVSGLYGLTLLKQGLDYPHAVKIGPDGKFWIGELKQISRFKMKDGAIVNWEIVVSGLAATKDVSHPLSQFTFDPRNNDLYINSGSPSDHCFVKGAVDEKVCPETVGNDFASILKIPWSAIVRPPVGGETHWQAIAHGLRNSMAMVIHPSGLLVQGENGRDFSDVDEPFEEMNVIDLNSPDLGTAANKGFNYGWPYCYDFAATSPEWEKNTVVDCGLQTATRPGDYQKPFILIPPHAAPLAAGYYHGKMFPQFEGKLLMTWHGYRPTGHRLVSYDVDSSGRPIIGKNLHQASYIFDRGDDACAVKKPMEPRGGLTRFAPYNELISRWNERKGWRPSGTPASFTVADDGSIWMVEDKNQTIVRLAKTAGGFVREACDPNADDRIELLAWRRAVTESPKLMADFTDLNTKMITKYCASCHDGGVEKSLATDALSGLDFVIKNRWFTPGKPEKSKALQAISHEGTTPGMPQAGSAQFFGTAEGDDILKIVKAWAGDLPADVDSRYAKTVLKTSRKIRLTPSAAAQVCGTVLAGVTAYIDPRPSTFVRADGWVWARLYVTPDNKALAAIPSPCTWPIDGIFYVATQTYDVN